jgi:flagellar hook-associated protein 1 FlgK
VEGASARKLAVDEQGGVLSLGIEGVGGTQALETPGGAIGGMLHSHNDVLAGHLEELDTLAYEFATQINAVHAAGVGLDGAGGRDLFEVTGPGGAAKSLRVNGAIAADPSLIAASTDAAGLPGGNDNLQAMIDLAETALPNGNTLEEGLQKMRQGLGANIRAATLDAETASASLAQLESLRGSVEGVSLEEEMIALTEAQRGFEAAMKVVQAGDEMFDTILSLKR